MGVSKKGILGPVSGKVGAVVCYTIEGEDYMRSLPVRTKPRKSAELQNNSTFGMVQDTLSPMLDFLRVSFKGYGSKRGGAKGALSYNRKYAVIEENGIFSIDPSLFRASGGSLPGVLQPTTIRESADSIRFNWDTALPEGCSPLDQVLLLAVDFPSKQCSFLAPGAFRSTGTELLYLWPEMVGKEADLYIGFVAEDRSRQSDSQYLGKL